MSKMSPVTGRIKVTPADVGAVERLTSTVARLMSHVGVLEQRVKELERWKEQTDGSRGK